MTGVKQGWVLWVAIAVSIVTYQCHWVIPGYEFHGLERKPYYIGVALFICLMAYFIYVNLYKCYGALILFGLGIFNLLDELFFDPSNIEQLELCIFIIIIIAGHARIKIKQYDKYCTK